MGPVEDVMQIWHVTSKGERLNVSQKFHTHGETRRDSQTKAIHTAAERVWAPVKKFFEPHTKDGQAREKIRKHSSVWYAR